ncbi:hypothetical protein ACJ6WF_47345 [Streptomyces sp. MMS24-I2-30]|uniref:hypothetical protein n=1 Tax=Streptomyces sp. MMS24-I2-30 TaxID=3351564 RepID=UPI0038968A14
MDQLTGTGDRDQSAAWIQALYFPQDGSLPLVPTSVLPSLTRRDAPEPEAKARRRMHHLPKPKYRNSTAEEKVLRDAEIPWLQRESGGFHIDPGVTRENALKRAGSSAVPALPPRHRPQIAAPASSPPVAEVPAWPARLAAGAAGAAGDPFATDGHEGATAAGRARARPAAVCHPAPGCRGQDHIPLGQDDGVYPAQPGSPDAHPGFAEALSGGSGDGLNPVVYEDVDVPENL